MIFFLAVFISTYLLDLTTKILVRSSFPVGFEKNLLPIFSLTHVQNTGIAFGLFPGRNLFFVATGLIMTSVMVVLAWKSDPTQRWLRPVLALILGGAWGNLTDRIVYGHVTDFLDFYWQTHHWPAFNVADSAICIGAAILFFMSFRRSKHAPDPL